MKRYLLLLQEQKIISVLKNVLKSLKEKESIVFVKNVIKNLEVLCPTCHVVEHNILHNGTQDKNKC